MLIPLAIDNIKFPHPCLAALTIKLKTGKAKANAKTVNPITSGGRPKAKSHKIKCSFT